jgi:hypothetical protein
MDIFLAILGGLAEGLEESSDPTPTLDMVKCHDYFVTSMPRLNAWDSDIRTWLEIWYTGKKPRPFGVSFERGPEFRKVKLGGEDIRRLTQASLESYLRNCRFHHFDAKGIAQDVGRAKLIEVTSIPQNRGRR